MHIYDKQCEIMQKKSMEESKHSDSVFLQWNCAENAKKTQKIEKLKRKLLTTLKRYVLSMVVQCERARPEDSDIAYCNGLLNHIGTRMVVVPFDHHLCVTLLTIFLKP